MSKLRIAGPEAFEAAPARKKAVAGPVREQGSMYHICPAQCQIQFCGCQGSDDRSFPGFSRIPPILPCQQASEEFPEAIYFTASANLIWLLAKRRLSRGLAQSKTFSPGSPAAAHHRSTEQFARRIMFSINS